MFNFKIDINQLALRLSCYVVGAGAFGVFTRWMQLQIAYNEEGLPDPGFWNVAVAAIIIGAMIMFIRKVDELRNERYYISDNFNEALRNEGRFYGPISWVIGVMMSLGGFVLLMTCETDPQAAFLRILALLGVVSGISFPLTVKEANSEEPRFKRACVLSVAPMALFAFWLVTCYKINSINGVVWDYAVEIISVCVLLLAFFYAAGFQFAAPKLWRTSFYCMFGAFLAIMCLADERYFGMQLMFIAAALMLIYYNWVLLSNLQQKEAPPRVVVQDGFDRL